MKRELSRLARRYASALRTYLKEGAAASLRPARRLGREAAGAGLETLDVARMHDRTLASIGAGNWPAGRKRADAFCAETMVPIEQMHRAALDTDVRLTQGKKLLDGRTRDLAGSERSSKQGLARRRRAEGEFERNGKQYAKQLEKSHARNEHLRHVAHEVISAQEAERKKISRELQDDVIQTLLAINVRLLSLRGAARGGVPKLTREIALTQRLVEQSVQSINRFAHRLEIHQRA